MTKCSFIPCTTLFNFCDIQLKQVVEPGEELLPGGIVHISNGTLTGLSGVRAMVPGLPHTGRWRGMTEGRSNDYEKKAVARLVPNMDMFRSRSNS